VEYRPPADLVSPGGDRSGRPPRAARWWLAAFAASLLASGGAYGAGFLGEFEGPIDWVWLISWVCVTVAVSGALQWWWARTSARALTPVTRDVFVFLGTFGPMGVAGFVVVLDWAWRLPVQ
jgi:hypothetical protein